MKGLTIICSLALISGSIFAQEKGGTSKKGYEVHIGSVSYVSIKTSGTLLHIDPSLEIGGDVAMALYKKMVDIKAETKMIDCQNNGLPGIVNKKVGKSYSCTELTGCAPTSKYTCSAEITNEKMGEF